jgi:hypothetical protein
MTSCMSLHVLAFISATVLESVCQLICQVQYLILCQMLWVPPCIETTVVVCYDKFSIYFGNLPCLICRLLYANSHMSVFICWIPYASYYEFTVISVYMPISVPVSAYSVSNLACQLYYTCIYMPAHECQIFPVSCLVRLYVNLSCYMSNCYISFHMLYAECYGLYAKFHMLDCNMPNAMSFSMTTEQVGHLIIYINPLSGYDYPYCRYREEITIIPLWL